MKGKEKSSNRTKMNTEELLQNKGKLKEIVEKNPEISDKIKKV